MVRTKNLMNARGNFTQYWKIKDKRWQQWFGDLTCRDFAKSKKPDKFLYRPTDRPTDWILGHFWTQTEHIFDCRLCSIVDYLPTR